MGDNETTLEKGNRHENEANNIIKRVYGAGVEKVDAWGNHDPFGFVDIIAIKKGHKVKFIQVKTNRFTKKDKSKYSRRMRLLPEDNAVFEVWVRHDRQGWKIYEYDNENEEYKLILEIDTCDTKKAGDIYREFINENN